MSRILFLYLLCMLVLACTRQPSYPSPPVNGEDVVLEVSSLREATPRFFTYQYQDKPVSFFVLKLQNRVLSFLDACASCSAHKQGYRFEDGAVTCRYCNMKFPVYKLEKGLGGCYPIKIEGRMDKGNYRIPVATLEKMADKF